MIRQPRNYHACVVQLAFFVLCGLAAMPVVAETVLLKTGNEFGVGWLFLDADGRCRIVTPRHVIKSNTGELIAPELLQRNGRITATRTPMGVSDPDVDLAFLDAGPLVADNGCTDSRLTNRSLDTLLARMDTGVLNIITELDQQSLRVEPRVASIDRFGGEVIAVAPVAGEENLKSGMSGSVIMVDGKPLAMLYWVENGDIGLAYRFDAIAAYNSAAVVTADGASGNEASLVRDIALLEGALGSGRLAALSEAGGSAVFDYVRRRVVLLVDLDGTAKVSSVRIAAPPDHELGVKHMVIESDSGAGSFSYVRNCDGKAAAPLMQCAFAPRQATRLRITFAIRPDSTARSAVVASLTVTGEL